MVVSFASNCGRVRIGVLVGKWGTGGMGRWGDGVMEKAVNQ